MKDLFSLRAQYAPALLWIDTLLVTPLFAAAQTPPLITQQPLGQTTYYGFSATFNVTATGDVPLFYQWQFNGINLVGATDTSLTLTNLQPTSAGSYQVIVSNIAGSTTSAPATLFLQNPAPHILSMPSNKSVLLGNSTTLSVAATGYLLSYQWRLNGTNPSGCSSGEMVVKP